MGAGSSSMACFYKRTETEVRWYGPDTDESLEIQNAPDGFGRARDKSFRVGSTLHPSKNRRGNLNGELAGSMVFYSRASSRTDYSKKPMEPFFDIKIGTKIFAKAFFSVPTGMMPIGENNLPYRKNDAKAKTPECTGYGPVLLAPIVRAIALFVYVDGKLQKREILCEKSARSADNMRSVSCENDDVDDDDLMVITGPIRDSFVTFCPSRAQDAFFFLHIPILVTHEDCLSVETGNYSVTIADAFHQMFSSLSTGKHQIRVSLQIYYDHSEYSYFILDRNMNARGVWKTGLLNDMLASPHPDPDLLTSPDTPMAEGIFTINISFNLTKMLDGILDRKPPVQKYTGDDADVVRKEAAVVAMGKIGAMFGIQRMPNLTVLTSEAKQVSDKDKDGNKFTFKVVEFVACWVNESDSAPHSFGRMFEGAMAKGQISPNEFTQSWSWYSRRSNGKLIVPEPIQVKNKHILSAAASIVGLEKKLVNLAKNMAKNEKHS